MEIRRLTCSDDPAFPILCRWMQTWWGESEGFTQEKMSQYMRHSILPEFRIPQTFVMFDSTVPVGMFQFTMNDCDVRPDVYPWLANVYICMERRGQGLFCFLMASVMENARKLGISSLYLYTQHVGLYEKFGFTYVEPFQTFCSKNDEQRLYVRHIGERND